ncbi:MAG: NAD(P)-dependent oxidoreductase [Pseudomonadota bacterium]
MSDLTPKYDNPVAVIGGAGFLGQELVKQLVNAGCPEVRVLDLCDYPADCRDNVHVFRIDTRTSDLTKALKGVSVVFHLAACQYHSTLGPSTYRLPFFDVNVYATQRLLDVAQALRIGRFVFASTNMVYGYPQEPQMRETHPLQPFGPYGHSKLEAEKRVERACEAGLDASIVRPAVIIGPGRVGLFSNIFERILHGSTIWIIGPGNNRVQMVASEDCARLLLLAGASKGFSIYNCGADNPPTMRELFTSVIDYANSRSQVRGLPSLLVKTGLWALESLHLSPYRKDQYAVADLDFVLNTSAAKEQLGWSLKWTTEQALIETFKWYCTIERKPRY